MVSVDDIQGHCLQRLGVFEIWFRYACY